MTEQQHLRWDEAENAVREADQLLLALYTALPDDLANHAARMRLASALGSVEDAAMFVQRARVLVGAVDV